jgi:hypothetical protein
LILASSAVAQTCPKADVQSPLVLERLDTTTEVTQKLPLVVTETKFRNGSTVKTTYYQGLVELDRVQRDKTFVFKPKDALDKFFPIRPNAVLRFDAEHGEEGQPLRRTTIELAVVGARKYSLGDCTTTVWLIERRIPGIGDEMRLDLTYYFSDEFKSIVAREYPEKSGRRDIITYTRVWQ